MLAIRARYKPYLARSAFSSEGGNTVTNPSSSLARKRGSIFCFNSPFGPFTETVWSFSENATVTPLGNGMGSLPTRDIISLINVTQYFAPYIQLSCFLVGNHAFGSRENGNSQSVQYAGQFIRGAILAQARRTHPLQLGDSRFARVGTVFQSNFDIALFIGGFFKLIIKDISFVEKHFGHLLFNIGGGHFHYAVTRLNRIGKAGQIIGYRVWWFYFFFLKKQTRFFLKRAEKIVNNLCYPNCYPVSLPSLAKDLDTQQPIKFDLPTGLGHSGNFSLGSQLTELVTAKSELSHVAARTSGELTTAVQTHGR